jgi:hypothetical protein
MKNSTQQEILLIRGTTFSMLQLCKKNESAGDLRTNKDELEEACWNGLLQELLPEIFSKNIITKKSFLWQIRQAKHFLELEWDELPGTKDNFFSIDPYVFLGSVNSN